MIVTPRRTFDFCFNTGWSWKKNREYLFVQWESKYSENAYKLLLNKDEINNNKSNKWAYKGDDPW